VKVLHPESVTVNQAVINTLNEGLRDWLPPPEIMLQERPLEDDTIALFRLCKEQGQCFKIINRTLMAEKAGEKPPQLRMLIMGQAGTGKSEVMKAVIWHSFQHEISRYIGASAYQWKAALLLRTANFSAVSCCAFFGVNNFKKYDTGGHSDSCKSNFNSDVRLLFIDECGTISLPFLCVSGLQHCLNIYF
jgi:hypothetical protein